MLMTGKNNSFSCISFFILHVEVKTHVEVCLQLNSSEVQYLTVDCCYIVHLNYNFSIKLIKNALKATEKHERKLYSFIYWTGMHLVCLFCWFIRRLVSYLLLIYAQNAAVFVIYSFICLLNYGARMLLAHFNSLTTRKGQNNFEQWKKMEEVNHLQTITKLKH